MRILINGVFTGGNCPPFYDNLKKRGHDIKIVDVTYFNEQYKNFSGLIKKEDMIFPAYNSFDFICYKLFEKTGLSIFIVFIVKKLKKIVLQFKPDVIINHQLSKRANLMLNTGFKPQVGLIYGSEIKGNNINMDSFKVAVSKSDVILTTTQESKNKIVTSYPKAQKKIKAIMFSFFDSKNVFEVEKRFSLDAVLYDLNFQKNDIVIFDNRSLRDEIVLKEALAGYMLAIKENPTIKILLIKGFSGDPGLVEFSKEFILKNNCTGNFKLIENDVSDEQHYKYILCSNIVTSFLRADQFGEVIIQGMLLKKHLLLFDLPQYHQILANNAFYVDGSSKDIFNKIKILLGNPKSIDVKANYDFVLNNLDAEKTFEKIDKLLNDIKNEIY